VRNRFPPPTSPSNLKMFFKENGTIIAIQTVQNLYESIPRRIVVVLKEKCGTTPY
jgi:hypothetical protein